MRLTTASPSQKKPRGQALSVGDHLLNHLVSKARVVVENVLAGSKRGRSVQDVLRLTTGGIAELVREIACGLHTLRVSCRHPLPPCDVRSCVSAGSTRSCLLYTIWFSLGSIVLLSNGMYKKRGQFHRGHFLVWTIHLCQEGIA